MKGTRADWSEAGFVIRGLVRIIASPIISVSIIGLVVLAVLLLPRTGELVLLGSIIWPALILVVLLLARPSIGGMMKSFRLDPDTRRNHALEHGTICFLRKHYGKRYKLSGSSESQGFRLAGARTPRDIQEAFSALIDELKSGNRGVVVARGCGSNIVTAQSIGLVLLAAVVVVNLVARLSPVILVGFVTGTVLVVALVRYPIGMWIQRQRFLLLDFEDARIESIMPIKRARIFERHPVYFVKTRVHRNPS